MRTTGASRPPNVPTRRVTECLAVVTILSLALIACMHLARPNAPKRSLAAVIPTPGTIWPKPISELRREATE